MVWTAESPGHPTLLLVPTIHRLVADDPRIDASLAALADRVQAIVLEAPADPDPAQVLPLIRRYGMYPAGDNMTNHLSAMTPARLAQCARQSGLELARFFQLKPWLAALAVTFRTKTPDVGAPGSGVPQRLNYPGIDQRLSAIARSKNVPLFYLETLERGLRVFSDMPPTAQEAMLMDSCDTLAGVKVPGDLDVRALETAWIAGDALKLDRLVTFRDPKETDGHYAVNQYIYRTNTDAFVAALAEYDYFHGKGPILIAVGAGHFFGAASLIDRLRALGYTVTPPQNAAPARARTATVANRVDSRQSR